MKKILLFTFMVFLFSACQESLEKRAERVMKEYSEKHCPMPMGPTIMMDSCAFELDTHTLHYYYSLMGTLDNDSALNAVTMRQLLVDGLKNETTMRIFKEAGYQFKYTYFSQTRPGKVLFETVMTKEDYK